MIASLKEQLPDYPIYSIEELTSLYSVNNVPGLSAFIGVIIGLSIVVGFLVVFLSMYTAVLERTREIGILKALGASPAYVLNIIFRETVLLAVVGSRVRHPADLRQPLGDHDAGAGLPDAEDRAATGGRSRAASRWCGALLGAMYPAWKAARQDAIEALSYE